MSLPIKEDTLVGDVLHEWTIQEYQQHDRSRLWHLLAIILAVLLVVYGIFTGNFLFSLIIILAGIILFLQSQQSPGQIPFQVTELGVVVGSRFYQYTELSDFYIIYNPPEVKTLFIDTKSMLHPMLRIPLLDTNPMDVRHALRDFLPEDIEKEDEPLSDRAARNWQIH